MRALREFDSWAVRATRREQNSRADELVNEALDEGAGRLRRDGRLRADRGV
jgi:hypothetical protein